MPDLKEVRITVTSKNQSFPIDTENTRSFWETRFEHMNNIIYSNDDFANNNIEWSAISPLQVTIFLTRPDQNTMVIHRVFNYDISVDNYFNKWMGIFEKYFDPLGYSTSFEILDFDQSSLNEYEFVFYNP